MLSLKQITHSLILLLPLVALASGCQSTISPLAITNELMAPATNDAPVVSESGVSMSMGDAGFSRLSNSNVGFQPDTSTSIETQQTPPGVNKHLNSARQLELAGRYQESISKFEWLLHNGLDSALVCHRLGVLYDKTGQSDRALPYYQKAINQDPTNAELLCDIGYRYAIGGDFQQAANFYQMALTNSPNLDRAHNNLGVVMARNNRPDLAMGHFLEAGCTQQEAEHNLARITNSGQQQH